MEKAKLTILKAEINRQAEEIAKIYAKIAKRAKGLNSEVAVEGLAYHLHNLYCAFEDLFQIIAEAFENNIEEGRAWHKELLRRMSLTIKGVRPNLISGVSRPFVGIARLQAFFPARLYL